MIACWGSFGGPLKSIWGRLWASWAVLRACWAVLGPLGGMLEAILSELELFCAIFDATPTSPRSLGGKGRGGHTLPGGTAYVTPFLSRRVLLALSPLLPSLLPAVLAQAVVVELASTYFRAARACEPLWIFYTFAPAAAASGWGHQMSYRAGRRPYGGARGAAAGTTGLRGSDAGDAEPSLQPVWFKQPVLPPQSWHHHKGLESAARAGPGRRDHLASSTRRPSSSRTCS